MCWEMNKNLSKDKMQMFDEHKKIFVSTRHQINVSKSYNEILFHPS